MPRLHLLCFGWTERRLFASRADILAWIRRRITPPPLGGTLEEVFANMGVADAGVMELDLEPAADGVYHVCLQMPAAPRPEFYRATQAPTRAAAEAWLEARRPLDWNAMFARTDCTSTLERSEIHSLRVERGVGKWTKPARGGAGQV